MLADKELSGRTIVAFSDVLFEEGIIEKMLNLSSDIVLAIDSSIPKKDSSIDYVVAEKNPVKGTTRMRQFSENKVVKIGKKLDPKKARFEFTGIAYFSEKGIDILISALDQLENNNCHHQLVVV